MAKVDVVASYHLQLPIISGCICKQSAVIPTGVRLHFHSLVRGLTALAASKAQLGLGHSYSRAKVKFNVNRADNMIIQSIALLDQLDKDINTFSMRVRYAGLLLNVLLCDPFVCVCSVALVVVVVVVVCANEGNASEGVPKNE